MGLLEIVLTVTELYAICLSAQQWRSLIVCNEKYNKKMSNVYY